MEDRYASAAWLLLAGLTIHLVGLSWDLQWHADVGPDFFFTAPHSIMYLGTIVVGLTSLIVVLLNSRDPQGQAVTVLKVFRAPVPYLIAGLGAAGDLLYGAADLWWHGVYGFDVGEVTPSHLGLFLSTELAAVGVVMAFAAQRGRPAAPWGLATACAVALLLTDTELAEGMSAAALGAFVLGIAAGVTGAARWMVATAVALAVVSTAIYVFSAAATPFYADLLDLAIRDFAAGTPVVRMTAPLAFPVVAAVAAGVMALTRRHGWRPTYGLAAAGAAVGACYAVAFLLTGDGEIADSALAVVLGAGMAAFGWSCAAMLRWLAPKEIA